MGTILSALLGPLMSGLSAIAGPLAGWLTGRSEGRSAAVTEAQASVIETLQREAQAVADAPKTRDEIVAAMKRGEF